MKMKHTGAQAGDQAGKDKKDKKDKKDQEDPEQEQDLKQAAARMRKAQHEAQAAPTGPAPEEPPGLVQILPWVGITFGVGLIFGLIMAALTAALMSTADTLINATSAVTVNDIWKPYVKQDATDRYYLSVARWVSIVATVLGLLLVLV